MTELLYASNTAGTPTTVTASDVAIFTAGIKPNQYNACEVTATVEVSTTGTSATTNNAIKLKLGTTVLKTINYRTDAVIRTATLVLNYVGDISQGGSMTVTISGAGTDAQTTFTCKNLYVQSIA